VPAVLLSPFAVQAAETSQVISIATAMPTQPAAAVEKAAALDAAEDVPAATAAADSSHPAETVQMNPNAGGLPTDGVTAAGHISTPESSSTSINGLSIAPVYSYKKDGSITASQAATKSVSGADIESASMLIFVFVGLLALAL
jgi:hypothetical protein